MAKTVDEYAATLKGWQADAATALRNVLKKVAPEAIESIKWGQPVYEFNGPFAWWKGFTNHVTIGFWRGAVLIDPQGILESGGKRMAHLKIRAGEEISERVLEPFIRQAVALNAKLGNPTMQAQAAAKRKASAKKAPAKKPAAKQKTAAKKKTPAKKRR